MTQISGRVLLGLDEFKLRTGHLSIICETAKFEGGSSHRLAINVIDRLTAEMELSEADFETVGDYLAKKKFCAEIDVENSLALSGRDYRYPEIGYRGVDSENKYVIESLLGTDKPTRIWFQDYCLAQPNVRSRVGAVTTRGKIGSKTGVSHILDWAQELDLVSRTGIPSPIAELIAYERKFGDLCNTFSNPYVLHREIVPLGYAYICADFDMFSELLQLLLSYSNILKKKDATNIYVKAVRNLTEKAETTRNLSNSETRPIYSLWRDLEQAARRSRSDNFATNTAWHRASSRFETLTDLGFLSKTDAKRDDRYQYKYQVTDQARRAAESLDETYSINRWIDDHLLAALREEDVANKVAPAELLTENLLPVIEALKRPTSPLPMDAVSVGLAMRLVGSGNEHSLGGLKEGLRQLAINQPELARVSRGTTAQSAGMISFDVEKLGSSN